MCTWNQTPLCTHTQVKPTDEWDRVQFVCQWMVLYCTCVWSWSSGISSSFALEPCGSRAATGGVLHPAVLLQLARVFPSWHVFPSISCARLPGCTRWAGFQPHFGCQFYRPAVCGIDWLASEGAGNKTADSFVELSLLPSSSLEIPTLQKLTIQHLE